MRLGSELQLNIVELKKAERLGQLPPALSAWVTLFEHWQKEDSMSTITDADTRRAYDKLKSLSADDEARRIAFMRERALHDKARARAIAEAFDALETRLAQLTAQTTSPGAHEPGARGAGKDGERQLQGSISALERESADVDRRLENQPQAVATKLRGHTDD